MGTVVTIDVVHDAAGAGAGAIESAIERALGWFVEIEAVCTRFDPRSELRTLTSQAGIAVAPSPVLFEAIQFAVAVAEASAGAFDPTIGHLMEARGFNREHRSGATLTAAVDPGVPVTYRDVVIDRRARRVMLRQPLVLDLGAVAKGLAIDLAARELSGGRDFAIDAGGDLYLGGLNEAGAPWAIGIQDPDRTGEIVEVRHLSDVAICTSGGYERTTSAAGEHHLLDPRTGCSPRTLASATVLAASAMVADALATAAFVLGPADGLRFLETQQVEGLLIGCDGTRHRTESRA